MIRFRPLAYALVALATGCLGAVAAVPADFTGDFSTSDLSQWDKQQAVSPDRISLVTLQGVRAARFEVRQGDNPLMPVNGKRATGDRAELVKMTMEDEGQERTYAWRTLFPQDFPAVLPSTFDPYAFQIFAQWHQEARTGSPPLYFLAMGDTIALATNQRGSNGEYHGGPIHWRAPMDRGAWHAFKLHVRWSASPTEGLIELWHNGVRVLPPKHVATLVPGQKNYFKLGLYRSALVRAPGAVYHAGFTMAPTGTP